MAVGGEGLVLAALSAVFNGSFASVFKLPSVAACELDPLLFQLYVSFGAFLSSLLVLPFLQYNPTVAVDVDAGTNIVFDPLGLLAGGLFVLAITFSFQAVDAIGVALGQGLWGGGAILVSYIWGVAVFGNAVSSAGLALVALVLLCMGVLGIAFSAPLGRMLAALWVSDADCRQPDLLQVETFSESTGEDWRGGLSRDLPGVSVEAADIQGKKQMVAGLVFACLVGLSGGSILVPMHYVEVADSGLAFVLSFGTGALVVSPCVCLLAFGYRGRIPPLHLRQTLWAGILSGFLWNAGNVCSIAAIPRLGYSIAYPILQCALFVSGLWGVFAFREIKGAAIIVFFVSGTILVAGALCLAFSSGST